MQASCSPKEPGSKINFSLVESEWARGAHVTRDRFLVNDNFLSGAIQCRRESREHAVHARIIENSYIRSAIKNASRGDFADLRNTYNRMAEERDIPLAMKATELLA